MSFHRAGPSRLLVSRFRHESLRDGQTAQVGNQPEFWDNLRERINFTVVDTPAASQSVAGLVISRLADMVVLVVEAGRSEERRGGKEWGRECRSRCAPCP